jgi:hypothetical protein
VSNSIAVQSKRLRLASQSHQRVQWWYQSLQTCYQFTRLVNWRIQLFANTRGHTSHPRELMIISLGSISQVFSHLDRFHHARPTAIHFSFSQMDLPSDEHAATESNGIKHRLSGLSDTDLLEGVQGHAAVLTDRDRPRCLQHAPVDGTVEC